MPCHWHVLEAAAASQVGGGSCKGLDIAASRDGNRLGQNAYEIMRRRNPSPSSRFPICYNLPVPRNAKPRPRDMPPAVVVACLMRITMLHRRFDPRQRPGPLDQRKKESKQTNPQGKPVLETQADGLQRPSAQLVVHRCIVPRTLAGSKRDIWSWGGRDILLGTLALQ